MTSYVRVMAPSLLLLVCAAAVGCQRDRTRETASESTNLDRDRSGTTTVTGANVARVANDSAVDRIVAARCAREATCNNIGVDKSYTTREGCTKQIRGDMREDLSAKECPRGIDAKELGECLEAIQKEDCENPIDNIGRLIACRSSDLCLSSEVPNR